MRSEQVRERVQRARQEAARLAAEGVRAVALTSVDNAGIARVKAVPAARLPSAVERGVGMSPCFDAFLVDDSATSSRYSGGPDGDLRLFPDLDRLTVLAGQPGWAWAPVDRYDQQGGEHPGCQRLFARRMTRRAAERGLSLRMGFETEWTVSPSLEGPAYGMARIVERSAYLGDVLGALVEQGVEVLQIHPEYTEGQFEVSVAPTDPVGAADLAVLVRETIRAVSVRHGLTPFFGPVVTAGGVGNGAHLHLSLWQDDPEPVRRRGRPVRHDGRRRVVPRGRPGGPARPPRRRRPLPASYLRLEPSRWAGAFQCWGLENREAALRFIAGPPDDPDTANAEVKCFDPAANPYLAVGAVIAAGLAGLDAKAMLPDPVAGDPAVVGGRPRLPASLPEALRHFTASEVLREAMGDPLFEAFAAVRKAESALFEGKSAQEIADATRGRY